MPRAVFRANAVCEREAAQTVLATLEAEPEYEEMCA
jgi:hypothetical protein